MITNEQLEKYKQIYKKQHGKDISDQEAMEQATKLLRLLQLVYKPMKNYDDKKNIAQSLNI